MYQKLYYRLMFSPCFHKKASLFLPCHSVHQTLNDIFAYNSAGLNCKPKYTNLLPLIEFAYYYSIQSNTSIARDAPSLPMCQSLLDSILNELIFEKTLLSELKENPTHSTLLKIYLLFLNNWDCLKNLQTTYRLLSAMSELETNELRQDSEETKLQLFRILRRVMKEWKL